jgi:hypothetical protein
MDNFDFFLQHCNPVHVLDHYDAENVLMKLFFKTKTSEDLTLQEKNRIALMVTSILAKDQTVRSKIPDFDSSVPKEVLTLLGEQKDVYQKINKGESIRDIDGYNRYGDVDYILIPSGKCTGYFERSEKIKDMFPVYWEKQHKPFLCKESLRLLQDVEGTHREDLIKSIKSSGIIPSEINVSNENILYICLIPRDVALFHLGVNTSHEMSSVRSWSNIINTLESSGIEKFSESLKNKNKEIYKVLNSEELGNIENSNCADVLSFPCGDVFYTKTGNVVHVFTRDEFDITIKNGKHIYTGEIFSEGVIELIKAQKKFCDLSTPSKSVTVTNFYNSITVNALDYCRPIVDNTQESSGGMNDQMQNMMRMMGGGDMTSMMNAMPAMGAMGAMGADGQPSGCSIC